MASTEDELEINVEAIMQEIRAEILAQRAAQTGDDPVALVAGKRLSPKFYEHLYQAGLNYDQIAPKLLVTQTNLPLIGGLVDKAREKIHLLVIFYLDRMAREQMAFNKQILQAMNALGASLEEE